jgi:hypothetical protein
MVIENNTDIEPVFKMVSYALVVDNKFACIFQYPLEGNQIIENNTAALKSNPKITLSSEEPLLEKINRYSLIINDEVVGTFSHIKDEFGGALAEMINAALQSDPFVVDITGLDTPSMGDMWDGTKFVSVSGK